MKIRDLFKKKHKHKWVLVGFDTFIAPKQGPQDTRTLEERSVQAGKYICACGEVAHSF